MSRFNTGNPLGSGSPLDLDDNAKNMDLAVNSEQDTFQDRLGKSRLTWAGMESGFGAGQVSREQRFNTFIASSGYQFAGDYAPGIEITEYNQLIRDENGEFWRVSGQVDLPYVTTGAGIPEGDALVPAGDAVLRKDLANPSMGAAMVARAAIVVSNIAELRGLNTSTLDSNRVAYLTGRESANSSGGGYFRWSQNDLSSEVAEDVASGIYVAPASDNTGISGAWVRDLSGFITPEMFGAYGDGVSDDTEALVAAADKSAEYTLIMNGQYRKDADNVIVLPSGANVEGTGTIKLLPHSSANYEIFGMTGAGDITIRGITVDGNLDENSATGGEWGMGFNLRGTKGTVTLDAVTAINCWGDGIYIGTGGDQGCEHVEVINTHIRNCRRQGISVVAVDHLVINGGLIEDINGTSPEAGIDFEPNYQTDKIRRVRVTGLEVRNTTGPGILIHMINVGLTEEYETDMEFTNLSLTECGIEVRTINEMTKGRVFIDYTARDLRSTSFRSRGVPWSSTLDLTLRPKIHNHNLDGLSLDNPSSGWGYAFYMDNQHVDVDVDFRGPRIIDLIITEDEPMSAGIVYSSDVIKDTRIINPIAVPNARSNINPTSKYPYEAVKLEGEVGALKMSADHRTGTMTRGDFTVGAIEFSSSIGNGTWTLPTGTVLGTNSVFIYTSGGRSLTVYPPSGGNFAGSDVDDPVVIPAQPGSGVKITPLGDDVFGAVPGFYTRN